MAPRCIVISPFLPRVSDAGHRKRTYEACATLAQLGYSITFIHTTFEGNWYWRSQEIDRTELGQCGIDSYHEIYCENVISVPPKNGKQHQLDEWWPTPLQEFLSNHLRRNYYEIAVVHNVWLSKALDFFPTNTIKMIETHDLFSVRADQFAKIGAKQDFFSCTETDEIFGLNRSNIAIAIKAEDAKWIEENAGCKVVTITSMSEDSVASSRQGYLHPKKITFGFMGSAHAFNVHCLREFISYLSLKLRSRPSRLEFVVAGTVSARLADIEAPFVRHLGFVENVDEFYNCVDFVVSPLDYGTGVKIKVAEAIDKGVPILVTKHSAEGTAAHASLVSDEKYSLAKEVLNIAQNRPDYRKYFNSAQAARTAAKLDYRRSRAQLSTLHRSLRKRWVVYIPELLLDSSHPLRAMALSTLRLLAGHGSVFILHEALDKQKYEQLVATLPAAVNTASLSQMTGSDQQEIYLDVNDDDSMSLFSGANFITSRSTVKSLYARSNFFDRRFALSDEAAFHGDELSTLPYFSDAIWWDPGIRHPIIGSSESVSFVRASRQSWAALKRLYEALFLNHSLVLYESDNDLSDQLPKIMRSGILSVTAYFSSLQTNLEYVTAEHLKCFGVKILSGMAHRANDVESVTQIRSIMDSEKKIVRDFLQKSL